LRASLAPLKILDEKLPAGARMLTSEVQLVLRKILLRLPDAWIRVCVGLKGIKSIYKTALDGAASNRVAKAIAVAPQILGLMLMNFIF
jgi:hypothetical protein